MKPVRWEASAGALDALLTTRQFVFADLYTISLADSLSGVTAPLRYTTADVDIGYGGHVWQHGGPLMDQDRVSGSHPTGHWKAGLDVDTWDVVMVPRAFDPLTGQAWPDRIGDIPWQQAVRSGVLDGATVEVDRFYLPVWPAWPISAPVQPIGVLNIFTGLVGGVDFSRTKISISIDSHLVLLGVAMPRNHYGAACKRTLFDAGCGLSAAAFQVVGTVAGAAGKIIVQSMATPPSGSSGTFALGRIRMTAGQNAGFSRSIRQWMAPSGGEPGEMTLLSAFPYPIADGDPFLVWPGCDKSVGSCDAFANGLNFGGERFIPAPETAY